ncbi:CotH kinase family protein [Bacteroides sp.]|uniref:CotH kinase family protein n=1 Tax=Bacteroides sp. TaxID=29523 RepID=UPI002A8228BB|nr:CotH kinase family protein [Bacteroides sp.]
MAKKIYDEKIDKNTEWGGDASTGGLPVAGRRVQEFIKKQLDSKAGVFYYDTTNNRYLVFADEDTKTRYLENTTLSELIIGAFDAPFNYSAKIILESPTYNAIALGATGNYIDFSFDIENKSGLSTSESVICTYTFRKGSIKQTVTEQYAAGRNIHFNIDKYLSEGTNNITIAIQGTVTLAATTAAVTYQVVNLSIDTDLDISKVYDLRNGVQVMSVPFSVSGYGIKTVEWYLDGAKLDFVKNEDEIVDASSSRIKYITLSNLSQGTHTLQMRAYVTVDGEVFYSDTLYREIIVYTGTNQATIAAIGMTVPSKFGILNTRKLYGIIQYIPYVLNFATYTPSAAGTNVIVKLDNVEQGSVYSENGIPNQFTIVSAMMGNSVIELMTADSTYEINAEISKTTMSISEITDKLQLDFRAIGKSNNATDKDSWVYGDYVGTFDGFLWNNISGWVNNVLHINASASFDINLAPLSPNPSVLGKTIEIEFATTNVNDDDAIICDLRNDKGTGILITATKVQLISSDGVEIETSFNSNEFIRIAFVINRATGSSNKCMSFIYVNGIVSRGVSWASTDKYTSDKQILFSGSEGAEIKLKLLRIYDTALSADQVLNNYILYRDSVIDMNDVYERNNIYEESSNSFDYEKMMGRLPVMIVTGNIPTLENTTDKNAQITVDIDYYNLQDPTRSFAIKNAAMRPQGTSSMGYPKKNFRIYTQKRDDTILYDANNNVVTNKLYSFKKGAQPVSCWCLKADYAESSGTHNTGIARLWNNVLTGATLNGEYIFRTKAQKAALAAGYQYDVRTTVDGFPILMFYRLNANDPLVFIGKYNFNNDKSTPSVFGFCDIPGFDNSKMQCWEILNNGNSLALFTSVEGFDNGWSEAFESRYPDTSTPDTSDLKAFCTWMANVSAANFVTEKWEHLDVYKTAAYYVYLMRFGAVDQPVKNAMFTTEDGSHFFFINYDNDTINGLTNDGKLVVPPYATRSTLGEDGQPYYAGPTSRLWNTLEADTEFMAIVKQVDEALYTAGLKYEDVISMFDDEQANKWVERVYNQDAQYKYISPFVEKGVDNLFMLQGNRSIHRKYWLAKRFSYFDSLFVSGAYKAKSIEIKCINNTPAGQKITITAGTAMDYGYGINSVARESNVALAENGTHTFKTIEAVNLGDPIRIYAAPNIKGLDLSAMTDVLAVISLDKVYDASLGTKLTRLIVGNASKVNTSVESISGLSMATKLEYLDVQNMKGLRSLDLSKHLNIQTVNAKGSNISSIEFSRGAALQTLHMPAAMKTINFVQLPYLSTVTSEDNMASISTIVVKKCPALSSSFKLIYDWFSATTADANALTLDMDSIYWEGVDAEKLIEIGTIGNKTLKGQVSLLSVTSEQVQSLKSLYGNDCFVKGNELFMIAPDGVFILGEDSVIEGEALQLTAEVFSNKLGKITWSIISGGTTYQSIDNNGLLTTREYNSSRTITVQVKHAPTSGAIVYATKQISIQRAVRPTNGTINGLAVVGGDSTDYTLSVTPSGINRSYSVAWHLSGEGYDKGYVGVKSQKGDNCVLEVLSDDAVGDFVLNAVVTCDNGNTFTVTKSLMLGVQLRVNINSNQSNDATIAEVQATVKYGSTSINVTSGKTIGLPIGAEITITFPNVPGYKTPDKIEMVSGSTAMTESGMYKTELVKVSLIAWDGASVVGQKVTIDGTVYTWDGTVIQHKIAFDKSYTIATDEKNGYMQPFSVKYTASQVSRNVELTYSALVGTWIKINQNITDPATMISGDVNGEHIQLIRNNSHRYLGKYTAEGKMTICQLDDEDSTRYKDGTTAVLTGTEGDVFMKPPRFWYLTQETTPDNWMIGFYYGADAPSSDWNEWSGNALIGVYEAYSTGSKVYSRSGVSSSGSISQENFKAYARNRGKGFQIVDWQMHCVMALLYYAQYGHMNCQAQIGSGTNSYTKNCGQTDNLGMEDTVAGANGDTQSINFWGLENWWGNKYEWVEGIEFNLGIGTITNPDGSTRTVQGYNITGYYPSKMDFGKFGDIIAKQSGGSATTGYCDYYYLSTSQTARVVLRSSHSSYTDGGVAYVYAYYGASNAYSYCGSRLAFRGKIEETESGATFKALKAIG